MFFNITASRIWCSDEFLLSVCAETVKKSYLEHLYISSRRGVDGSIHNRLKSTSQVMMASVDMPRYDGLVSRRLCRPGQIARSPVVSPASSPLGSRRCVRRVASCTSEARFKPPSSGWLLFARQAFIVGCSWERRRGYLSDCWNATRL